MNNTTLSRGGVLAGSYVYIGKGSLQAPQIGDVRVSYRVLASGVNATVFGKLDGASITVYVDSNNHRLGRVLPGTREEAVRTLHSEYQTLTWILRGVGFLMMWVGLLLLFGPITTLLDFIPILGSISGALVLVVTFPVALVLSAEAILVSIALHNLLALFVVAAVLVTGAILLPRALKAQRAT